MQNSEVLGSCPSAGSIHLRQPALVAQRIEHLTTDQKVRGSNPFKRTFSALWGDPLAIVKQNF